MNTNLYCTSNMTVAEIKQIIFNLPLDELIALDEEISEKIAATVMMQLAETGFPEWNDPEEDIYNNDENSENDEPT